MDILEDIDEPYPKVMQDFDAAKKLNCPHMRPIKNGPLSNCELIAELGGGDLPFVGSICLSCAGGPHPFTKESPRLRTLAAQSIRVMVRARCKTITEDTLLKSVRAIKVYTDVNTAGGILVQWVRDGLPQDLAVKAATKELSELM